MQLVNCVFSTVGNKSVTGSERVRGPQRKHGGLLVRGSPYMVAPGDHCFVCIILIFIHKKTKQLCSIIVIQSSWSSALYGTG